MINRISLIAMFAFMLILAACARQYSANPPQNSAVFSAMTSQAGVQCQNDLRAAGVIGSQQGFGLVSDSQDANSMDNSSGFYMTLSEFKAACANFGPTP